MRLLRFLITYVMVSVLGLILFLFLALNHDAVQLDFFGLQVTASLVWVMLGAAALGLVVMFLLLVPGRIVSALGARTLHREVRHLDRELADREELYANLLDQQGDLMEGYERMLLRYQRLVEEHSRAVAERDDLRAKLAARPVEQPPAARVGAPVAKVMPRTEQHTEQRTASPPEPPEPQHVEPQRVEPPAPIPAHVPVVAAANRAPAPAPVETTEAPAQLSAPTMASAQVQPAVEQIAAPAARFTAPQRIRARAAQAQGTVTVRLGRLQRGASTSLRAVGQGVSAGLRGVGQRIATRRVAIEARVTRLTHGDATDTAASGDEQEQTRR